MSFKLTLAVVTLLFSSNLFAQNCTNLTFDTDASVFESPPGGPSVDPSAGIYPIGGSGIPNGNFAVCEAPGVQIAGRISERFVGPIIPNPGTADYTAPIGDNGDGTSLWNIDGHIDLSHAYGAGVAPETFADITYSVVIDCNPFIDVIDGPSLPLTGFIPDNTILFQFSQNLGFTALCKDYGAGFDPTADGLYTFAVAVSNTNGVLAELSINAIVGRPITAPKISAVGIIESQQDGFKFPDGTVQTTAAIAPPPPPPFPNTYINTMNTDHPPGGELAFIGCDAGDKIISGGGRCRGSVGLFSVDIMHKTCPANAAGACLDSGGTDFQTWAVECEGSSRSFAYAVCLDIMP